MEDIKEIIILIQQVPENKGGAEMIISYYEKWKTNKKR